ncbi:hypothetical protein GIB67_039449, partial [Kingdonia uniflora]
DNGQNPKYNLQNIPSAQTSPTMLSSYTILQFSQALKMDASYELNTSPFIDE